jgi:hypothetical protein
MVVGPALHASALRFWVSDADEGDFRERFGLPVDWAEISSGSD